MRVKPMLIAMILVALFATFTFSRDPKDELTPEQVVARRKLGEEFGTFIEHFKNAPRGDRLWVAASSGMGRELFEEILMKDLKEVDEFSYWQERHICKALRQLGPKESARLLAERLTKFRVPESGVDGISDFPYALALREAAPIGLPALILKIGGTSEIDDDTKMIAVSIVEHHFRTICLDDSTFREMAIIYLEQSAKSVKHPESIKTVIEEIQRRANR